MCAITGAIIKSNDNKYLELLEVSQIRGQDGTGITILRDGKLHTWRSPLKASEALKTLPDEFVPRKDDIVIGQNRLAIFGLDHINDQPLVGPKFSLVHNGNLFNFEEEFKKRGLERKYKVDTELILRIIEMGTIENLPISLKDIIHNLSGDLACLLIGAENHTLSAFKKFKPLHIAEDETGKYFFSTERIGLKIFDKVSPVPDFSINIYF